MTRKLHASLRIVRIRRAQERAQRLALAEAEQASALLHQQAAQLAQMASAQMARPGPVLASRLAGHGELADRLHSAATTVDQARAPADDRLAAAKARHSEAGRATELAQRVHQQRRDDAEADAERRLALIARPKRPRRTGET